MEKVMELLKSLKFLEALCFVVAAATAAFVPEYAVSAASLLALALAVLKVLGIQPEAELKKLLAASKVEAKSKVAVKPSKK